MAVSRAVRLRECPLRELRLYFDPGDAFCGGRTEVVRHYVKLEEEEGEEIRYVDVCSLYPWVNRTCEYPVGHPEELLEVNCLDWRT